MSTKKVILCDHIGCLEVYIPEGHLIIPAREKAWTLGWDTVGGYGLPARDFCPNHARPTDQESEPG